MEVKLPKGKYVLAVSGGVDSVVLLDLLAKKRGFELVVAHFDHGIRKDSAQDADLVASLAKKYGLKYVLGAEKLGSDASEERARNARYAFLKKTMLENGCQAIITAHHEDDLIETALINLIRGTGSAGLIALRTREYLKRPLLNFTKVEIINYAKQQGLSWREDETNKDTQYLRNYIRAKIIPRLSETLREELLKNIDKVAKINVITDTSFATLSQYVEDDRKIIRQAYSQLENKLAEEYLYRKLRALGEIDRKTVARINTAIKTAKPGSRTNIIGDKYLVASKEYAWLE